MNTTIKSSWYKLTLLLAFSLYAHNYTYPEQPEIFSQTMIVATKGAELKTGSGVLRQLNPGEVLVATQRNQEWLWIPLRGGWISAADLKAPEELISILDQFIETKPTAERYHLRGIAQQVLKNYPAALTDFAASLKLKPENAHIYVNRGNIRRLQREYDLALDDLNRAVQLNDNDANAYYIRGLIRLEQKQLQSAVDDLTKAIQQNPHMVAALNARGITYRELNQFDRALQDFNQAIKANNFVSEVFSNRAAIWELQAQFESAIKDYQRALELNPASAVAHNDLAWLYATCAEEKLQNPGLAVSHAEKACELTRFEDWNLLDTMATAYQADQQLDKASRTLTQAIQKAPDEQKKALKKKLEKITN
ncbi:tetratricopeptide repeat protein [Gimesia algae]|uniref:TPR repeat-containing protein YrrB n=1 Tax=Gimesia algae TaxID=2527971 RepID=A0A517V869_9PLAN|nr:tetratricopeptide repeat protein [Gimesia algae]QDT89179.1 TPR repeat-containing protein YrrB [Gimesia algae]